MDLCRLCFDPICEACIVKASIGKSENTFKNRCRFLCKDCWISDNPHRGRKFTARSATDRQLYTFAPGEGEFCTCSSRDGWLCLSCKQNQNVDAKGNGSKRCFGEGCDTLLVEDDKEKRRICIWCDKPMLRGRPSMQSRVALDQRLFDSRINDLLSQKDSPEHRHSNIWTYREPMTRRDLRGSQAIDEDDHDADTPQFLRHLDAVNYRSFNRRPPDSNFVFDSFAGIFRYDMKFLLQFRKTMRRPTPAGHIARARMERYTQRIPALKPLSISDSSEDEDGEAGTDGDDRPETNPDYDGHDTSMSDRDDGRRGRKNKGKAKSTKSSNATHAMSNESIDDSSGSGIKKEALSHASPKLSPSSPSTFEPIEMSANTSSAVPRDDPIPYEAIEFEEYQVIERARSPDVEGEDDEGWEDVGRRRQRQG